MWRDLRNAVRSLAHTPSFTATAVAALALAIGANGAIFGLVDALWFRPPGVHDPGTLVRIFATTPSQADGAWSWPEYQEVQARVTAFEAVAVRGRRGAVLSSADGSQELLLVNVVSTNFFQMLGVQPSLGRLFGPADEAASGEPGVVLGYAFWQSHFGGDVSVIGRRLQLGRGTDSTVAVLGVLPRTFRDLEASADRDVWLTPRAWEVIGGGRIEFEQRDNQWFEMIARRRAGVSVETAGHQLDALAAALAAEYPAAGAGRGARVIGDQDYRQERAGVVARAMLGLVLLVVLITCVNVANLLLARSASRAHEFAVRVALGASRWHIVRYMAAETLVLGALGTIGGIIVSAWFIRLLPALLGTPPGLRTFVVFQTDQRVMLFTAAVAMATTVLFGLAPAWIGAQADVVPVTRGAGGAVQQGGRFKRVLVGGQVAISLVLLCVAAVLARSYAETQRADIGFAQKPLLTLWTTFGSGNAAQGADAVRRLEALPGVTAVAVAIRAPLSLSGGGLARPVVVPGAPVDQTSGTPRVKFNAVSANYFEVFGTRIVRGRPFSVEEERAGEATVVVNEQFTRQFLPGRDAIGTLVHIAGAPHRIVGIAQDGVVNEVGEPPQAYMYLPFWRGQYGEMTFALDAAGDPATLAAAARAVLRRVDPALEPRRAISMAQYVEYATSMHRTTAALASILGMVGLVLSAIGVYGVVAYRTTRRTREIGIRMALGALKPQVMRLVLRDGLVLGLAGVVGGLPFALGATRLAASMLVGVEAWDAAAFGVAASVLLLGVWVATMIPARRATRIDPSAALRG